jgi:hypothetical protein
MPIFLLISKENSGVTQLSKRAMLRLNPHPME